MISLCSAKFSSKHRTVSLVLWAYFLSITFIFGQTDPVPQNGVDYILERFETYEIVAIGESHALKEQYDFLNSLLDSRGFQMGVKNIVVEFGNSLYQPILDDYIAGKPVTDSELQKVWMNTTQSPVDPWSSSVYSEFIAHVRAINQGLDTDDQIRLIAADPPIDWSKVHDRESYRAFSNRNAVFASIVVEEVLKKGEKALIIAGGAHLSKLFQPSPMSRTPSINLQIEETFPGSNYLIQVITGFGKHTERIESKMDDYPTETIASIKDTWLGSIPAPVAIVPAGTVVEQREVQPTLREDMYDAMLFLGKLKDLHWLSARPEIFANDSLWKELNRRSLIRFNHELTDESRTAGEPRPKAYR
ncbi:hypothetical protein [Roseivirga sp.]|uniref:hypothetical protein n=1 Tax=Roseivirga sp. TaxID=1964215 RepID=UPI003B520D47